MHGNKRKVESLCGEILEGVLDELRGEFEALPGTLAVASTEARERCREAARRMIDEAVAKRERDRQRRASQAEFRRQRDLREARDEILDEMLRAGLAMAREAFLADPAPVLRRLAAEGLAVWPAGQACEIHVPAACMAELPAGFLDEIRAEFTEDGARARELVLCQDEGLEAGLRLVSPDGRLRFDDALEDRFRRMMPALRAAVLALVDDEGRPS